MEQLFDIRLLAALLIAAVIAYYVAAYIKEYTIVFFCIFGKAKENPAGLLVCLAWLLCWWAAYILVLAAPLVFLQALLFIVPWWTVAAVVASAGGCAGCGLGKADSSIIDRIAKVANYIIAGFKDKIK